MRIIKFRAWDNVNNRMGYFRHGFGWLDEYDVWCLSPEGESISDVPCGDNINLMQFTGLTDKNGREVYEGDIVRQKHLYSEDTVGEVNYFAQLGQCCGWKVGPTFYMSSMQKEIEVLGNVHENPELLQAQPQDEATNTETVK